MCIPLQGRCNSRRDIPALHFWDVILTGKKPQSESYPKVLQSIGDHLRKRRLDLKLLQKDVAGVMGVETMTVNNWERNRCQPRLCLFPKIVQFLGYSPILAEPKHTLGYQIKAYRLRHGLTQKKLAKALGIDPATLARWEFGKTKPSPEFTTELATLLNSQFEG